MCVTGGGVPLYEQDNILDAVFGLVLVPFKAVSKLGGEERGEEMRATWEIRNVE